MSKEKICIEGVKIYFSTNNQNKSGLVIPVRMFVKGSTIFIMKLWFRVSRWWKRDLG